MINQAKKPNIDDPLNWTGTLKALADESRLQIIHALLKQELTVQDLSDILNIKIYNISKHLKILEASGLVQKKKDGIQRIYHITESLKSRFSEDDQVLDLGCCKFMFGDSLK
jgi:DNA-binding transcriptional ArsR family regulator